MTRFSVRIFLGYFLILSLAAALMMHTHVNTVQPALRQTVEDSLADTANLLAATLSSQTATSSVDAAEIQHWLDAYMQSPQRALIWGVSKHDAGLRIYVTNEHGIVIADTRHDAIGADYSRWNDIYLTLKGQYGARSTPAISPAESASTLYVAAPWVNSDHHIIGAVSVSRNVQGLQPYVDRIRADIFRDAAMILGLALLSATLLSAWIARSVEKIARYARAVSLGQRNITPPHSGPREIRMLAEAVDAMRRHLEGKAYVEQYVHALAHALKSPLAGLKAHLELLEGPLQDADRIRLLGFAQQETQRLQDSMERLLQLARLEQQQTLQHRQTLEVTALVQSVSASGKALMETKNIHCEFDLSTPPSPITGEAALLQLALDSLLANAIAFTPTGGTIRWSFSDTPEHQCIHLFNSGPAIPEFALSRIFERFFSMPRPDTGQRSSGLGLSLAREIALLHNGDLQLENTTNGVLATLTLAR